MTSLQPDPITVLRVHLATDPPGRAKFYLCPRSLAARMVTDSATSADELTDMTPTALLLAQSADKKRAEYGSGTMVLVGIADGNKWAAWLPPAPREPVPGSPGHTASQN